MNDKPQTTKVHSGIHQPDDRQVLLLSYGQDLLAELARHIIQKHLTDLPDLTRITILLPTSQSNTQLRKLLLAETNNAGYQALLGPEIDTLANWINRSITNNLPVITQQQRELMMVESLVKYPHLYGEASPWSLAESLLQLFDELSENDIQLPEKFDDFLSQVDTAYRNTNNSSSIDSRELTGEALLVHTLWQAWQQQMKDSNFVDHHTNYLLKLKLCKQQPPSDHSFYLAGFSQFSPAEINWLKSWLKNGNTSLWLQCSRPPNTETEYHPDITIYQYIALLDSNPHFPTPTNDYSHCLNIIYDTSDSPLKDRASEFARNHSTSPLMPCLSLFEARSGEHEALAIDLQVRQWLIEGRKKIGVVTENRRLARRVRALLERADIQLQDAAGWALSTTSAAATLERWLEAVEEEFAYQPLLDLLKSPFFFPETLWPGKEREDLLSTVFRFEQSIVLKENINRGLGRYLKHIRYRQQRLTRELAAAYDDIYHLLEIVSEAAKPLLSFIGETNHKPSAIFNALNESLKLLGLDETFLKDDAGIKILDEIKLMHTASLDSSLRMNWYEFRSWLGRTLEQYNFQPNAQVGRVHLMSMSQNPLDKYDALIIASAEQEYLPGKTNSSPFFNDGVRKALGLKSHVQQLSHRFYLFRRLLELSDTIVITRRVEHEDEHVACSPWVERIKSFHSIAYTGSLSNQYLAQLAGHPDTIITDRDAPLPEPLEANPGVSISEGLMPKHISASAYQQLIDCPFQFFAARCLKLEPPETIKEMLEKADYGERVHLCLQAFHSGANNLPGPFNKPISEENRGDAIQLLNEIANSVFAKDLEDNFLHRAWLKRWHELIPEYIEWQIGQQQSWKVDATELTLEAHLNNLDIPLRGRIDRIDVSRNTLDPTFDILDYKTGTVAKENEILNGESIQLPFYVLLASQALQKKASRVEYVTIDSGKVQTKSTLEGEALNEIAQQVGQRLVRSMTEIKNGKPMKAWGDHITCSRCQMSGVCRRESWLENNPA